MGDDDAPSRRRFLKVAAGAGIIGAEAAAVSYLQPDLTNGYTKQLAESIRQLPGLGYAGTPVTVRSILEAQPRTVLAASRRASGYWKGAPSMGYDASADRVLVHVRHRRPGDRGYKVTLSVLDPESLALEPLLAVQKDDLDAISLEGGEIVVEDGTYRWFLSYQSKESGDWRILERRGTRITDLAAGGTDLGIRSEYFHHKDPVFLDGHLYVAANSKGWTNHAIERVNVDGERPRATVISASNDGGFRLTGGHILGQEVFGDVAPALPIVGSLNLLWTSDERIYAGTIANGHIDVATETHLVSEDHKSIKYLDALAIGEAVILLWQAENANGSNDLRGIRTTIEGYRRLCSALGNGAATR